MDCKSMFTLAEVIAICLGIAAIVLAIAGLYIDYIIKAMNRIAVIQFGRPVYPMTTEVTKK